MARYGRLAEGKTLMGLVIPEDLKERLRALAAAEERTLSNLVVRVLGQYADTHAPAKPAASTKPAKPAK